MTVLKKRLFLWAGMFILLLGIGAVVHAALPSISLNSPASFPVDI